MPIIVIFLFLFFPINCQNGTILPPQKWVTLHSDDLLGGCAMIKVYVGGWPSLQLLNGLRRYRSHLGPVPQVSGRLCEAKPEAKKPNVYVGCGSVPM